MTKALYTKDQSQVIRVIENGGLIFSLSQGIPLILWILFIIQMNTFSKQSSRNCFTIFTSSNIFVTILYYFLLALPFIVYLFNIYNTYNSPNPLKKVNDETAISFPPGWEYCFSSDVSKQKHPKSIIATEDLKCMKTNTTLLKNNIRDIIDRFYYMNYILLLLVLAFKYHTKFVKVKLNFYNCDILGYSILFGIMGTVVVAFVGYEIKGLWVVELLTVLLTMNISCFILYLMTSLMQINK